MPLLRGCGSPENDKSKGHIPSTVDYVDRNDSFCCTSVHEMPPMGIFFSPPIEGGTAVKFYPQHYFLFLKGRMKGIWRLRELFVPFPGRCVQCPYFSQDRAKYLMSTCPSFSDRCFAKGNSIVLWFCHVSQGKSIFHLGTQNLMGRLRASINVWNSQ